MIISELIEILKIQDPNLLVLVDGYEGGYDDIPYGSCRVIEVQERGYESYCGRYDDFDKSNDLPLINALIIPRWF